MTPGGQSAEGLGCARSAVAAVGRSHEPGGTSPGGWQHRRTSVSGSLHHVAFSLRVDSELQSNPGGLWDLLSERGAWVPGESAGQPGAKERCRASLGPTQLCRGSRLPAQLWEKQTHAPEASGQSLSSSSFLSSTGFSSLSPFLLVWPREPGTFWEVSQGS